MTQTTLPISASIADLHWISGTWQGTQSDGWCEEIWSQPHNETIVGVIHQHDELGLRTTDLIWFRQEQGKVSAYSHRFCRELHSLNPARSPARFVLVESKPNSLTLYCDEIDGGAWIVYNRAGNQLTGQMFIGDDPEPVHSYVFSSSTETGSP